jgi:hypothetical protein
MLNWIRNNRITTISVAFIPIIAFGGMVGAFSEKFFIRPYVTAQADTVCTKRDQALNRMIYSDIGSIKAKAREDREFIAKTYYYQKATLTKAERQKADDDMSRDPLYKKFITGD